MAENVPQEEDFESSIDPQQGQQQIAFGMGAHPITGEPQLIIMISDAENNRSAIKLNANEALQFGSQVTAQGTVISVLNSMAQMAGAQQQPGLIVPGR